MLYQTPLNNILFLDIETVPLKYRYHELNDHQRQLFDKKIAYRLKDDLTPEDIYEQAGIWAEFGKVVVAAFGMFKSGNPRKFVVSSLANENEAELLQKIAGILNNFHQKHPAGYLCAHNGKEFDFPFLARRMIINRIPLPGILKMHGKKPWETPFCDTLELWQFGDRKHYTSLDLLAEILGIPTPKSDIDGSQVARIFYEENDLRRIQQYCESDVIALANVFLRLREEEILKEHEIEKKS